jgi:O-antigen/teichoic acid export membrane protein
MSGLKAKLQYLAAFGVARASLFIAPVLLANLVSISDYGHVETAQSLGNILSVLAAFGLSSTIPLILIQKDRSARWDTLLLMMVAGSAFIIATGVIGGLIARDAGSLWLLVPFATAALMLQGLWSTVLKSWGNGTAAVFVEASFWLAALAGGLLYAVFGPSMAWLAGLMLAQCAILLAITIRAWLAVRAPFGLDDLKDNLRLAAPLLFTAVVSIFVSTAGRAILGTVSPGEAAGLYAVLYRATALPLVVHQIFIIAQFRQAFSWDEARAGRLLALIVAAVAASALALWLMLPPLGWLLGQRFFETFGQQGAATGIILAQTVLWSAIAMNDLLNSRLKLAGTVAIRTALFLALAVPGLLVWLERLPVGGDPAAIVDRFVAGYAALMLGFYLVQCGAMYRKGARFSALWSVSIISFVCMIALSLL